MMLPTAVIRVASRRVVTTTSIASASSRSGTTGLNPVGRRVVFSTTSSCAKSGSSSSWAGGAAGIITTTTKVVGGGSHSTALLAAAGLAVAASIIVQDPPQTLNWFGSKPKKTVEEAVTEVENKFSSYWPRFVLIMFGPPGAGKGTHGPKIEEMLHVPQLSTGDMLRAAVTAKTPIGIQADAVMRAGGLVSDDIVVGIIRDRIKESDCKFGFILDGFPRTLQQAKALDAMLASEGAFVTKVIELQVPDAVLQERICGRWIHKESGRSYHIKYAPPKSMQLDKSGKPIPETMIDDETGQPLMQRKDDTAAALVKRLQAYHMETVPILDHYRPKGIVKAVNANQGMEGVWKEVLDALKRT